MKTVECYQTNDGQIFEDSDSAITHENEVFTAEIFEIMKVAEFGMDDVRLIRGMRKLTSADAKAKVLSAAKSIVNILEDRC